jgi:hypothetical protein
MNMKSIKSLYLSAIFMIFLIISLPFNASIALGTLSLDRKVEEKGTKTGDISDYLDNEIISALEILHSTMFLICTISSTIHFGLSVASWAIGFSCDCKAGWATAGGGCLATEIKWKGASDFFQLMEVFCCYINCGWCTGEGCGMLEIVKIPIISEGLNTITSFQEGMDFRVSPYENIWTAMYCICPGAILFNLRKLKTIYQIYDCCVEQAELNGLDTIECDKFLDYQLCLYWEGALTSTVIKIVAQYIIGWLVSKLPEQIFEESVLFSCLRVVLELAQIPNTISSVMTAIDWAQKSFDDPNCEDLGFDAIKDEWYDEWPDNPRTQPGGTAGGTAGGTGIHAQDRLVKVKDEDGKEYSVPRSSLPDGYNSDSSVRLYENELIINTEDGNSMNSAILKLENGDVISSDYFVEGVKTKSITYKNSKVTIQHHDTDSLIKSETITRDEHGRVTERSTLNKVDSKYISTTTTFNHDDGITTITSSFSGRYIYDGKGWTDGMGIDVDVKNVPVEHQLLAGQSTIFVDDGEYMVAGNTILKKTEESKWVKAGDDDNTANQIKEVLDDNPQLQDDINNKIEANREAMKNALMLITNFLLDQFVIPEVLDSVCPQMLEEKIEE